MIYLNAALAYGFGWLVGAIGRGFLRRNRVNSKPVALLIGVLGGFAAVVFSWMTYVFVITGYDFDWYWELLTHPFLIWDWMGLLSENPAWSIGRSGRSGGGFPLMYYIAWLLELAVIVGVSTKMCTDFVKNNILCGQCNDWVAKTEDSATFAVPENLEPLITRLGAGDASGLTELRRIKSAEDVQSPFWLTVQGHACPNCPGIDSYVGVSLVTAKKGKGDEIEYETKELAAFVPVSPELEKALFEPPVEAEPAESTAEAQAGEAAPEAAAASVAADTEETAAEEPARG